MATKREYLVGLGLAQPGRGRFSREALTAIAEAESQGTVFDEPVKAVSKGVSVEGDSSPSQRTRPTSESSLIRAWAADNGVAVGNRGRIPESVVSAYRSGDATSLLPAPKVTRPPQVRVRQLKAMYGEDDAGRLVGFAICRRCSNHINFCRCGSGPKPPSIVVKVLDRTDPVC